jgi:hypothetical protein
LILVELKAIEQDEKNHSGVWWKSTGIMAGFLSISIESFARQRFDSQTLCMFVSACGRFPTMDKNLKLDLDRASS